MNIDLTEFWTSLSPITPRTQSMLSEDCIKPITLACRSGRGYVYNSSFGKYQLVCLIVNDMLYVDYSMSEQALKNLNLQLWIIKHTKGLEFTMKRCCIWKEFNLPTVEQLNNFAKNAAQKQDTGVTMES